MTPVQTAPRSIQSNVSPDISIKVAASRCDREGAFRLAYNSYLRAGLCGPSSTGMRITPHQLLPSTDVIIAELRGEVISTLSLVRDGELGLPMESIYAAEVNERRRAGLRLAEASCLADRRQSEERFFGIFADIARVMVQMAERSGVDQLLIAVHPRHAKMYCRAMAFEQIGDDRDYPSVNGNPAVPLCLDFAACQQHRPAIWERFVGTPLPESITSSQCMSERDLRYFQRVSRASNGEKATPAEQGSAA